MYFDGADEEERNDVVKNTFCWLDYEFKKEALMHLLVRPLMLEEHPDPLEVERVGQRVNSTLHELDPMRRRWGRFEAGIQMGEDEE